MTKKQKQKLKMRKIILPVGLILISLIGLILIFKVGIFKVQVDELQNAGATANEWEIVGMSRFSSEFADYTRIAFNPSTNEPYVVCGEGNVKKFNGSSWIDVGVSENGYTNTAIAFNPSTNEPYIANSGSVQRFNGSSWVNVGAINPGIYTDIAFNPSTNEPYIVFQDEFNSQKATVMRFNGSSWVVVGSAGFSSGSASYISISFNPSTNEPYVAFTDLSQSDRAMVMKYNGSNWVNVGSFLSSGAAAYTSIAFNPSTNEPYVVFQESHFTSYKATVMRFNGSSWVAVGSAGFSSGMASYTTIAFNPLTNEPYVAYSQNKSPFVKKFNGSSWVDVGLTGFTSAEAIHTDIAFNPLTNEPYLVFEEDDYNKATVMKFNLNTVVIPSTSPVGGTYSLFQSVTLLTTTSGASIYYTTDGSTPTAGSTPYSGAISISQNTTLKAIAIKSGMTDSDVMNETYLIKTSPSVASPSAGTYSSPQSVTLSSSTSGASIYYTTDGSTPTISSTLYSGVISVGASQTIKAIAVKSGMTNSDVMSAEYVISIPVPTSTPSNDNNDDRGGGGSSSNKSSKSSKKKKKKNRTISNSPKSVAQGGTLKQIGRRFSKNSQVALYYSRPGGGYYPPSIIKTNSSGSFSLTYQATKPKGGYSWYAVDLKTGKRSKTLNYKIK